jgi:hypothetical protein
LITCPLNGFDFEGNRVAEQATQFYYLGCHLETYLYEDGLFGIGSKKLHHELEDNNCTLHIMVLIQEFDGKTSFHVWAELSFDSTEPSEFRYWYKRNWPSIPYKELLFKISLISPPRCKVRHNWDIVGYSEGDGWYTPPNTYAWRRPTPRLVRSMELTPIHRRSPASTRPRRLKPIL